MKKNYSVAIGAVIITIIVIIMVVISSLNLSAPATPVPIAILTNTSIPTATNTSIPTPTLPINPCAPENVKVLAVDFNRNAREFDDLSTLAQNTPREQLAPIITQLQGIRRKSEDYVVPSCMTKLREDQLNYMNAFIETLVYLYGSSNRKLTQKDVELINQGMAIAVEYHNQYLAEMAQLTGVTLPAPTATVTPDGTISPATPTATP